uniref:Uncharacterized protein n=1 Tax=Clostera anachoreta granulovirus TaxID=283675 RepID=Q0VHB2_9BBAC|nr:unknown [Clostera anachoreta granulovirus]
MVRIGSYSASRIRSFFCLTSFNTDPRLLRWWLSITQVVPSCRLYLKDLLYPIFFVKTKYPYKKHDQDLRVSTPYNMTLHCVNPLSLLVFQYTLL